MENDVRINNDSWGRRVLNQLENPGYVLCAIVGGVLGAYLDFDPDLATSVTAGTCTGFLINRARNYVIEHDLANRIRNF